MVFIKGRGCSDSAAGSVGRGARAPRCARPLLSPEGLFFGGVDDDDNHNHHDHHHNNNNKNNNDNHNNHKTSTLRAS